MTLAVGPGRMEGVAWASMALWRILTVLPRQSKIYRPRLGRARRPIAYVRVSPARAWSRGAYLGA